MPNIAPVSLCVLSLFGAGGDLTKRLLLPSIYNLVSSNILPDGFRLLGIDRQEWEDSKFREYITKQLKDFWGADADPKLIEWLTSRTSYHKADFSDPHSFDGIKDTLTRIAKQGNRLFYLAVGPDFIASIATQLSKVGLLAEERDCWSRLIV